MDFCLNEHRAILPTGAGCHESKKTASKVPQIGLSSSESHSGERSLPYALLTPTSLSAFVSVSLSLGAMMMVPFICHLA